jgi:hypothetical protein
MLKAIPNPTKTITVDFSIDQVKTSVRNIGKIAKSFHLREENEIINLYKFSRDEFLSMGSYVSIDINSISENKTEINVEVTRKLGAFDSWVEVQYANEHIEETFKSIAHILKNGVPIEIPIAKTIKRKTPIIPVLLGIFVAILTYEGMKWILNILF